MDKEPPQTDAIELEPFEFKLISEHNADGVGEVGEAGRTACNARQAKLA